MVGTFRRKLRKARAAEAKAEQERRLAEEERRAAEGNRAEVEQGSSSLLLSSKAEQASEEGRVEVEDCLSSSKPPFKKNERLQCGKRAQSKFTVAQLNYMRRHCFPCGKEFHTSKQLKDHNKEVHNKEKTCNICENNFASDKEHELHNLEMRSKWHSFKEENTRS